ncbi:MAG: C10 family peptidase [Muribaculaceae bacterium]|nr:C10 family peptidase [Muribaculaceae bacterium]
MKRSLLITGVALLAVICGNAAPLTPEQALKRLESTNPATRGLQEQPRLKMTWNSIDGEAAIYIFDKNNDKGFMLLSADDCVAPLLGYSDDNVISLDDLSPALEGWLKGYADQIEYAKSVGNILPKSGSTATRVALPSSWTPISPLVKTQWNQSAPFNNDCPKIKGTTCPTGCVATSVSQVMNYFKYPEKGQNKISYNWKNGNETLSLDFSTVSFNWSNMLDSYNNNNSSPIQNAAVANLMKAVGYAVQMDYGADASGAVSNLIPGALVKYFNYDQSVVYVPRSSKNYTDWATLIYNNLKNIGPVIYDGDTADGAGHSFICDGYNGDGYFHFNWGWGGAGDGYFLLDALNPSAVGIGGATGGFNFQQDIVLNVQPAKPGSKPQETVMLAGSLRGRKQNSNIYLEVYGDGQYPGMRYYGLSEITFDLGAKFEPANNPSAAFYQVCSNNNALQGWMPLKAGNIMVTNGSSGYPYGIILSNALKLSDNVKYKVTIAYKPQGGEWTEMPCGNGDYNYFYLTKSGSNYNFENLAQMQFDCTELKLTSDLYDGNAAQFNIKLSNTNNIELTRGVTLQLQDKDGNVAYMGDSFVVTLDPKQSYSQNWITDLTRNISGTLTKATDFYPALYDVNTGVCYYTSTTPVTMLPNPGSPQISLKVSLDNAKLTPDSNNWVFESSTDMQVTTTVSVTSGYFTEQVSVLVLADIPNSRYVEVLNTTYLDIALIKSGETKAMPVTLNQPNLSVDTQYYIGILIGSSQELSAQIPFTVKSNGAGIDSVNSNEDEIRFIYEKASNRLVAVGDVERVELYSISGEKLISTSSAEVDLSNLVKGIVVARAISRNGETISKKIAL